MSPEEQDGSVPPARGASRGESADDAPEKARPGSGLAPDPGLPDCGRERSRGLFREGLKRRLPQYVGVYLGGSFAVLQFVSWAVDRYLLSPHLPDLTLLLFGCFLPAVAVHAWYHGAPGPDDWPRTEKVAIGLNVLLAGTFLLVGFGGKDLGAVTTELALEDGDGRLIRRTVPKPGFRRHLALFPFGAEEGVSRDPAIPRLGAAVAWLLELELEQDLFVHANGRLAPALEDVGGEGSASLALLRELARGSNRTHFLTGRLGSRGNRLRLSPELYETQTGRLVARTLFEGPELTTLVDSTSLWLKRRLEVPEGHLERTVDLPAATLATADLGALTHAVEGQLLIERERWTEAVAPLREATRADPGFAAAWVMLGMARFLSNEPDSARAALERAMQLRHHLPETRRVNLEILHYRIRGETDRSLRLARMQAELLPDDADIREELAWQLRSMGRAEEAVSEYEKVLAIDPGRTGALRALGDLHVELGRTEKAEKAYRAYLERHPRDTDGAMDLARLERRRGDLDSARALFERASLLDPRSPIPLTGLADVAKRSGSFVAARRHLEEALSLAEDPRSRRRVLLEIGDLHRLRGRVDSARAFASRAVRAEGALGIVNELLTLEIEAEAGRRAEAVGRLRELGARLEPPWDGAVRVAELLVHRRLEDVEATRRALVAARGGLDFLLGDGAYRGVFLAAEADLLRWQGRCEEALPLYERAEEAEPERVEIRTAWAECLRRSGRLDRARRLLEEGLRRFPVDPRLLVALAEVERVAGRRERARERLDRALATWSVADPDFAPAGAAHRLRARLGAP